MQRILVLTALWMACLLPVSAGVLNFDDINTGDGVVQMPVGYGGFNWDSNFYVLSWTEYNGDGNTYQFPSMDNAVYNGYGVLQVSMSNGTPFIFNGADFTGWDEGNGIVDYTATSISVSGYLGGSLVGTASIGLPADGFVWLSANMGPVDDLVFTSSGSGQWWIMDNFTYNGSSIPEPGSLLLCAAGLGLAAARRLRRR